MNDEDEADGAAVCDDALLDCREDDPLRWCWLRCSSGALVAKKRADRERGKKQQRWATGSGGGGSVIRERRCRRETRWIIQRGVLPRSERKMLVKNWGKNSEEKTMRLTDAAQLEITGRRYCALICESGRNKKKKKSEERVDEVRDGIDCAVFDESTNLSSGTTLCGC